MDNRKKIDDILDEFDFEKVHRAMDALNWIWASLGVPSIADLRKLARDLLNQLSDYDGDIEIRSGGFIATKKDEDFSLLFYIDNVWSQY